jgi:hypothetical protein
MKLSITMLPAILAFVPSSIAQTHRLLRLSRRKRSETAFIRSSSSDLAGKHEHVSTFSLCLFVRITDEMFILVWGVFTHRIDEVG